MITAGYTDAANRGESGMLKIRTILPDLLLLVKG
jgi:hypothetical protein